MIKALAVGAGGFLGASLRYLVSLLPYTGVFPWPTLGVNLLGALAIGTIAEYAALHLQLSAAWLLFWRVGLCGGFTTFSTFSLEAAQLLEQGRQGLAVGYALLSVVLCVAAVFAGKYLVQWAVK